MCASEKTLKIQRHGYLAQSIPNERSHARQKSPILYQKSPISYPHTLSEKLYFNQKSNILALQYIGTWKESWKTSVIELRHECVMSHSPNESRKAKWVWWIWNLEMSHQMSHGRHQSWNWDMGEEWVTSHGSWVMEFTVPNGNSVDFWESAPFGINCAKWQRVRVCACVCVCQKSMPFPFGTVNSKGGWHSKKTSRTTAAIF